MSGDAHSCHKGIDGRGTYTVCCHAPYEKRFQFCRSLAVMLLSTRIIGFSRRNMRTGVCPYCGEIWEWKDAS